MCSVTAFLYERGATRGTELEEDKSTIKTIDEKLLLENSLMLVCLFFPLYEYWVIWML